MTIIKFPYTIVMVCFSSKIVIAQCGMLPCSYWLYSVNTSVLEVSVLTMDSMRDGSIESDFLEHNYCRRNLNKNSLAIKKCEVNQKQHCVISDQKQEVKAFY